MIISGFFTVIRTIQLSTLIRKLMLIIEVRILLVETLDLTIELGAGFSQFRLNDGLAN